MYLRTFQADFHHFKSDLALFYLNPQLNGFQHSEVLKMTSLKIDLLDPGRPKTTVFWVWPTSHLAFECLRDQNGNTDEICLKSQRGG